MTKFEEDPENSCYSEHYTDPDALVVDACRHSFNFFFLWHRKTNSTFKSDWERE